MNLTHTKKTLLVASMVAALSGTLYAAEVPVGTVLAEKQVLVRNAGAEVQSLDPHKAEGVPEDSIISELLEGLTIADPQGHAIPGAAEKWENQDFKVWTFHLRKQAKWSNGDPVTANDFVFAWKRIVDPKIASPYASFMQYARLLNVDEIISGKQSPDTLGVKALDDHTLQVTLSEPVPYLPRMLLHYAMAPLNQKVVEKFGDKWTLPGNHVSNGAFQLKEWVVNERIVLVRNPNYWNNSKTVLNQITYLPIPSEITDVNRYRVGENEITYNNLPVELFQKLKKELPQDLHVDPYLCTYYYEINNQKPPFNDPRVRTALKLGMDRDVMVNKVLNQGQQMAYSYTPPFIDDGQFSAPEWFGWTQEQRNAEAVKLLAEAGYTKDKPLSFSLLYNTSDLHQKMAIAAASLWKKNLGVEVKLRTEEWKTFLDTRHQGNYDIARAGWCADYNEPSAFLNTMLSNSSNNTPHYQNSAFDKLVEQSLKAKTDAERAQLYQQAEALLDKDSVIVPIYYYANTRLVKPYIGGYVGNPLGKAYGKDLYIIKQ